VSVDVTHQKGKQTGQKTSQMWNYFWVYPDFPNNLVHGKALVKTIESLKTG
jgi:hypothetical protein